MSKIIVADNFDDGKDYNNIVFIFACPGRLEQNNECVCSGCTGGNLSRLLNNLCDKYPELFPSKDRYDYRILNSSEICHYKALTGDTLPSNEEILDESNLKRIASKLKNGDLAICFGVQANEVANTIKNQGDIDFEIIKADHLSMSNLNTNKKYIVTGEKAEERTWERIKQACADVYKWLEEKYND